MIPELTGDGRGPSSVSSRGRVLLTVLRRQLQKFADDVSVQLQVQILLSLDRRLVDANSEIKSIILCIGKLRVICR